MRKITPLLIALALAGCSASVVDQGPRHVVISDPIGNTDTHRMAEQACQQQGRHAVLKGQTTRPAGQCFDGTCEYFECVE